MATGNLTAKIIGKDLTQATKEFSEFKRTFDNKIAKSSHKYTNERVLAVLEYWKKQKNSHFPTNEVDKHIKSF